MKLESPVLLQPAQIAADFADALAATLPLQARFDALHRAARAQIDVPRALREDRLNRLRTLVKANAEAFAAAISQVENGVPAVMADIEAGWDLLMK